MTNIVQAATREGNMLRMLFGARDDPRFVVGRQPHGLRPVELRVLKRGQPNQPVLQCRDKTLLRNIEFISQDQFQVRWQWCVDRTLLAPPGRWLDPRIVVLFFHRAHANPNDSSVGFGLAHHRLDLVTAEPSDRGEEGPLVFIRLELFVYKETVAVLPRGFLQWQCNQVSKAAFGQSVLIGKQPVVRFQPQFRAVLHGLGQDVRSQFAGEHSRNGMLKEEPGMATVAGAGTFQCGRQAELSRLSQGMLVHPFARRLRQSPRPERNTSHPGAWNTRP